MNELEACHWWFVARRDYLDALIRRCVPIREDSLFCEVGAGTGGNLGLLGRYACTDAIESKEDAVDIIRDKKFSNIRRVALGQLPDGIPFEEAYSAVFALDVVEHVEHDADAVTRLAAMLSPAGKLVLTVPAYQWLWSGHDVANQHYRRYDRRQIVSLIRQAGLKVEFCSYFNTLLFPLKLLQHLLTKLASPGQDKWGVEMPSAPMNIMLRSIFSLERHLAGRVRMPFGLSIAVVATKR